VSRHGRTFAVLPVALLVLFSVSVSAETDVYTSGVVRGKYLYNTDDEVDASVADTRVDLDIGIGALTLGAVYRAYLLSDEGYNPADVEAPPTEVKHRYAALEHQDLAIRAGHFFSTFGRGLTLRSYEDVDLEHDTVLDGLSLDYRIGDVSLAALSGIATDDEAGTAYTEHVVRAARAGVPVADWLEVAGSVVERSRTARDEEVDLPDEIARFEDTVVGGEVSVWAGPVTFAAEYATRDGANPATDEDEVEGHAAYASATLSLAPITVFGEFKDYEEYDHLLVNPPTAVRDHLWTLMNRATYQIDLDDERGFLVEATAPVGDAFFLMGGASEARNHDGDLRHWEMFGQVDWTVGETTAYLGAARSREYVFAGGEAAGKFTDRTTVGATLEAGILSGQMVEVTAEGQATETPEGKSYEDYIVSAAYYPGLDFTLIATAERTTSDSSDRDSWFMAEVRKLVDDDFEVSLSAGTERGGKKCTGGVCFIEPEFEGVRLRFTRFF
jgi:hypothetical protein